ncbi:outer membrane protein with beta-barrel domain [Halanaerobium saccharolyticum]|uniref:Outer membrane protein with beta-barrel domain n=1 Tax=Halanaerobium saccharolyticum TaxID=43595 RepID=A0A4R6M1U2_9FIRM|nr:outer membrane beta-barrel protein [Halanaerobium saccharolyticum]TDO95114.1 outer membrane protein with beta-barrel domain [Halanaerobium saccharolyticum]
MKNKIMVLMIALMLVGLMAGNAAAAEWKAVGGMAITNVTLDKWNSTIDDLNTLVASDFKGAIATSNIEKMENIDRVPMIYVGAKKRLNNKWTTTVQYERIFGAVETNFDSAVGSGSAEIDVALNGIGILADYSLNQRWSLGGGIAFYKGTKDKDFEGQAFAASGLVDKEVDLDAVSYRLGVGYERSFADNWDFNAGLDYLYLEMDDDEEGNVYSNGFSYTAGLTYSF